MILAGFNEADVDAFLSGAVARLNMPGEEDTSSSSASSGAMPIAAQLSSATLRAAPPPAPKAPGKPSLLDEIQRGQKLKAVREDDERMKKASAAEASDMLSMLASKMSERRFKMGTPARAGSDSDSDSDSSGFSDSDSDDD